MFEVWLYHYNYLLEHPESMMLSAKPFSDFNVSEGIEKLTTLKTEYLKDKDSFIIDFLNNNGDIFRSIDTIDFNSLMHNKFIDECVFKKYKSVFAKASRQNRKANIIKNAPSMKRIFYAIRRYLKYKNIDDVKFLANYWYSLRPIEDMKKLSHLFEWQTDSSSYMQMEAAKKMLEKRDTSKPFYLYKP